MSEDDRLRWNEKYCLGTHASYDPSSLLTNLAPLLPSSGRTIDLAGGAGRNAIWLANRGLDVSVADVSDVALKLVEARAVEFGVSIETQRVDFETEPFPAGPWDLIVSVHFLLRPLFTTFPAVLANGGTLVCIHPTRSNLERHDKPPSRYLLEDGELPKLATDLEVVRYEEGWLAEGRHEAVLVARAVGGVDSNG
ncbi:MAG: class I SAM-dependent methyltransferase [Planctomycetes bacterium]|nr:class I SAM-dependent methyltransferase [Planctomycetota bacterium]